MEPHGQAVVPLFVWLRPRLPDGQVRLRRNIRQRVVGSISPKPHIVPSLTAQAGISGEGG